MRIPLDGESNFRDLGGYIGCKGRRVRSGLLFRSGDLSRLSDEDLLRVQQLGICVAIDLRTSEERVAKPNRPIPSIEFYHLPLLAELGANSLEDLFQQILFGKKDAFEYMLGIYREFEDIKIQNWKRIFQLILQGKPTLWHCTAGKDRTGMTSALILEALGVSREVIFEDYMSTNEYGAKGIETMENHFRAKFGNDKASKLQDLIWARREYLEAFWESIDKRFGGPTQFFQRIGADPLTMQRKFLET